MTVRLKFYFRYFSAKIKIKKIFFCNFRSLYTRGIFYYKNLKKNWGVMANLLTHNICNVYSKIWKYASIKYCIWIELPRGIRGGEGGKAMNKQYHFVGNTNQSATYEARIDNSPTSIYKSSSSTSSIRWQIMTNESVSIRIRVCIFITIDADGSFRDLARCQYPI